MENILIQFLCYEEFLIIIKKKVLQFFLVGQFKNIDLKE
jgi:hypothetical protein